MFWERRIRQNFVRELATPPNSCESTYTPLMPARQITPPAVDPSWLAEFANDRVF